MGSLSGVPMALQLRGDRLTLEVGPVVSLWLEMGLLDSEDGDLSFRTF